MTHHISVEMCIKTNPKSDKNEFFRLAFELTSHGMRCTFPFQILLTYDATIHIHIKLYSKFNARI